MQRRGRARVVLLVGDLGDALADMLPGQVGESLHPVGKVALVPDADRALEFRHRRQAVAVAQTLDHDALGIEQARSQLGIIVRGRGRHIEVVADLERRLGVKSGRLGARHIGDDPRRATARVDSDASEKMWYTIPLEIFI